MVLAAACVLSLSVCASGGGVGVAAFGTRVAAAVVAGPAEAVTTVTSVVGVTAVVAGAAVVVGQDAVSFWQLFDFFARRLRAAFSVGCVGRRICSRALCFMLRPRAPT